MKLFPTPVGVVPREREKMGRLPYSSPRPWGCFLLYGSLFYLFYLFPTPVGVFLIFVILLLYCAALPHARGGGSTAVGTINTNVTSSPRPWGGFRFIINDSNAQVLFPTPVGGGPTAVLPLQVCVPLPHARGGGSGVAEVEEHDGGSSPRPWGGFYHREYSAGDF